MKKTYSFKHKWILWLMIIPFVIIFVFIFINMIGGELNITDIGFGLILLVVSLFILSLTVYSNKYLTVWDDAIEYHYIFFRRKVFYKDIIKIDLVKVYHRHQLIIKTRSYLAHRIWLDFLSPTVDTIIKDIEARISQYELTISK